VFRFSLQFCLNYFSFSEKLSEIWSKTNIGIHIKHPFFFSDFNESWSFVTDFQKIIKYQILWKFVHWEPSCSMRTETGGQTDRHEANSRSSQFCDALRFKRRPTWVLCRLCEKFRNDDWFTQRSQCEIYRDFSMCFALSLN
jgi:hypothetical protein